ncbi:hypothetical protein PCAR4_440009 [Paraburkholderia caribensis]|nr:hypothetical protein PCAR4_440009 [Paraburkholderia caribensis]
MSTNVSGYAYAGSRLRIEHKKTRASDSTRAFFTEDTGSPVRIVIRSGRLWRRSYRA